MIVWLHDLGNGIRKEADDNEGGIPRLKWNVFYEL
jgi:hypothetical protein